MNLPEHLLTRLGPWRNAPGWVVALSGGLDSSVLLHALAAMARTHALPPLRAIHIHHGLQAVADSWPAHCRQLCERLSVPFEVVQVRVAPGPSLEQAARDARYAALGAALGSSEVMLTGQHCDDQAETLLLRLLRGAGVRGAAAMPAQRALGSGMLIRPLLNVERDTLQAYAQANGLDWIEDPSNADPRYSRNYLRHHVMAALRARWPAASANLARSAAHFAEALSLLDEVAEQDLLLAQEGTPFPWLPLPSLALAPLCRLSEARQRNAIRAWLAPLSRLPDTDHWAGWAVLRDAAPDATPVWALADGAVYRAVDRVWWVAGPWREATASPLAWERPGQALNLPGNGAAYWHGPLPLGQLEVRYRQGGERLSVPGRGSRDLKRLLNEAGVPGFVRGRLPLLFLAGQLVAVANLPRLSAIPGELRWQPPTIDRCLR